MDLQKPGLPIAEGRTAEIFAWGEGRVLKLFRPDFGRSAAEYEFDIARAIDRCDLPAPRAFDLVTMGDRVGIVYERVDGASMLAELMAQPQRAPQLARTLADLHFEIHQRKPSGLPRQRERFLRWLNCALLDDARKDHVRRALNALPDGDALCHGDFHPDNIILTSDGPMIIDWANASIGNPLGDVGWTALLVQVASAPPDTPPSDPLWQLRRSFGESYLRRTFELDPAARGLLDAWMLPVAAARLGDGIPEEWEALVKMIEQGVQSRGERNG